MTFDSKVNVIDTSNLSYGMEHKLFFHFFEVRVFIFGQ